MENTKKLLRAVLAISLSIFLFVASCYPASAQIDYDALKRGVVKIIAYKPENMKDTGAGIVVGVEGNIAFILTALHVVTYQEENQRKEAQKIEVVFFGKRYMKFTAILFERYHEELDMAVIVVDPVQGKTLSSDLPNFTLGDISKLREGDRVSTIGHPPDFEWEASINTNIIQGLNYLGDSRKFRFTTTAIERGHSGGPVFNEQGSLLGMVTRLHPSNTIAVKINAGIYLLKLWGIPTNLTRPSAFGAIVVDSKPSGSQVFLDGQPKGSTTGGPLSIVELEAGSYSLRVTKEGYAPWEESVDVESGEALSIVVQLEGLAPTPRKIRQGLDLHIEFVNAWQRSDAGAIGGMSHPPFSLFGERLVNQEEIVTAFERALQQKPRMKQTVEVVGIKTIAELQTEGIDPNLDLLRQDLGLSDEDTAVEIYWRFPIPTHPGTLILLTRTIEGKLKLAGIFKPGMFKQLAKGMESMLVLGSAGFQLLGSHKSN